MIAIHKLVLNPENLEDDMKDGFRIHEYLALKSSINERFNIQNLVSQ